MASPQAGSAGAGSMTDLVSGLVQSHPNLFTSVVIVLLVLIVAIVVILLWISVTGRTVRLGPHTFVVGRQFSIEHQECDEDQRRKVSGQILSAVTQDLAIFAGDLSWLARDAEHLRSLTDRGRKVRILVDGADASDVQAAKSYGAEVRKYDTSLQSAPMIGLVVDPGALAEGRAKLVVIRKPHSGLNGGTGKRYVFQQYSGDANTQIIRATALFFDVLFSKATPL